MKVFRKPIQRILLSMISLYRMLISPLMGSNCRFYPSCSKYAYKAIHLHGPAQGTMLTVKRLLKCHPFHPGGYDPVPEKQ